MNKEELFLMNLFKDAKLSLHMNYKEKRYKECYNKIMESHPNYVYIIYIHIIKFKQKLTAFTSTKIRSLRHINNGILFTIL